METQNITLAVPKTTLRKFRELAVRRHKSVSGFITEIMEETVANEEGYQAAKERFLRHFSEGMNLGTYGHITWTRDELHERE